MMIDRAIEILDPDHREVYDSVEPINEACRMAVTIMKRLSPAKPGNKVSDTPGAIPLWYCAGCGFYLGPNDAFCSNCGKAVDWDA